MNNEQLEWYAGEVDTKTELIENNLPILRDHFLDMGEYNEQLITDKNCEVLFSDWLRNLDIFALSELVTPF